jgi:hypothetical protein
MAVLPLLTMSNTKTTTNIASSASADNLNPAAIFHDFLGSDSSPKPAAGDPKPLSPPPSTSAGRPPLSTTSDLASAERQGGYHFEGIPYYGPRSELSGHEIGNRFAGSKRSNSDSTFIGSSRDSRFPQTRPDSLDNSNLMKMIRSAGGERSRRVHEDETVFNMQQIRPNSAALILQPNASRWERSTSQMSNSIVQYPPRAAQLVPFGYNHHQPPPNRFSGPSIISQMATAADEGSRTGIKGSGILSSGGILDRNLPGGAKMKSGARASEPESSTPPGRTGFPSSNRQMTIFYGGQAHVFDDVHPNKADVIMALAGSNGGSWSTNYMPKSSGSRIPTTTGENSYMLKNSGIETGSAGNSAMPLEFRTRLPVTGSSSHQFGPDSIPPAGHQGSILMKDARNVAQIAEASNEDKRDVV